jgi:hypothetical protein
VTSMLMARNHSKRQTNKEKAGFALSLHCF